MVSARKDAKSGNLLRNLQSATDEAHSLEQCYSAQMAKRLLGHSFTSDDFATTDRLSQDLSYLFKAPLEKDLPFLGTLEDLFQRSEMFFLSYNGNILFDVLALMEHIHAGPEAFRAVENSAERFRHEIILGKFKKLSAEGTLRTLAFLLLIYPKVFKPARKTLSSTSDAASRLYNEALEITASS